MVLIGGRAGPSKKLATRSSRGASARRERARCAARGSRVAQAMVVALASVAAAAALAAEAQPQVWSSEQLTQLARTLLGKAASNPVGVASETIARTPGHYVMLVARLHTGEAEEHDLWTDEIVLRQGEAELLTGGVMTERSATDAAGEYRGRDLVGAAVRRLHAGDVAEVPAGVPHLMRVLPGAPVVTLSLKVK